MGDLSSSTNGDGTAATSAPSQKPIIIAAAFPASGHSKSLIQTTAHLAKKGYTIYFISGAEFKSSITKHGIEFIDNPFPWLGRDVPPESEPDIVGPLIFAYAMKHVFVDSIPTAFNLMYSTLERVRDEHPGREVLILHEACFFGLIPFLQGAPLPKGYDALPTIINLHTSVDARPDPEVPPFGPGLPYDPTPENLALWQHVYKSIEPVNQDISNYINTVIRPLGATRDVNGSFLANLFDIGETTLLFTTTSTDYPPRSKPSKIRYIGSLPVQPLSPDLVFPDWWPTLITANAALPPSSPSKKKIIFLSQGTVHINYDDLLIPAFKAFASRTDLTVIAVLGVRGAKLTSPSDPTFTLPSNARVLDYFPYDAILPYADAFISNAGYNGFMHGVVNGVPMIMAGVEADKGEVSARAEYIGMAISLRVQRASQEALGEALDKLLGDGRYKRRAVELKRDNEGMDALGSVEGVIEEFSGGGKLGE